VEPTSTVVLQASGICKSFAGHAALQNVDCTLFAGEVHALLGENGAGKSTLIKILTGAYTQDSGDVLLDGVAIKLNNPLHAQSVGIGAVYQEVNLLPNLTVAQNLYIGRQPTRFGFVNKSKLERDAKAILVKYGLDGIDVNADLNTYSIAVQQIIAIARAVELSAKVLILDEPTASLDRNEVQKLFSVIRDLKSRGLAIVFITHFLDQVFELADRVTVLRNGKRVGNEKITAMTQTNLVRMMLGKDLTADAELAAAPERKTGEKMVDFSDYGLVSKVKPFSMHVNKGEVVGIAGLLGSGRTEIARLMFGIDAADSGQAHVDGKPVSIRNSTEAINMGFGFCPEDRRADGILGDLSVRENIIIAMQGKLGWFRALNRDEQIEVAGRFVESLDIRAASPDIPVKLLSGGNQQKVILARWLATDPRFLILDEPTRGIDVGAHAEIVRVINRLREDGLALIVISSELDEIVAYSSRIMVMRDREMVAELHGPNISPNVIVQAIANHKERAA
jgi:galactofuranose transport system ATP-binding protein